MRKLVFFQFYRVMEIDVKAALRLLDEVLHIREALENVFPITSTVLRVLQVVLFGAQSNLEFGFVYLKT